jgi:hypothetical protein
MDGYWVESIQQRLGIVSGLGENMLIFGDALLSKGEGWWMACVELDTGKPEE